MLRKNSSLRSELGENGYNFLEYCAGAVERILPHVESGSWIEEEWQEPGAFWTDVQRREFRLRVSIGSKSDGRTVSTVVARRSVPVGGNIASQTLDIREHDICKRIAKRISLVLATSASTKNDVSLSNRKIFEARKRETAALGAGEKLVLGHPLAATIGDSARCMQNLEKVLFTGPKTSDTVTFIQCD